MFSIIIPTLQKNIQILKMLLNELVKDDLIGEIILIDNSLKGFEYNSSKVKIIIPDENLFVNPSWNLGVQNAKYEFIGILNDDILIPKNFISQVFEFLQYENIGVIGIDTNGIKENNLCDFNNYPEICVCDFVTMPNTIYPKYWGIAIFCKKENYYKIPNDIKIWCGDNYLLKCNDDNKKHNFQIKNSNIKHFGSLSSNDEIFNEQKYNDLKLYTQIDTRFNKHYYLKKDNKLKKIYKTLVNQFKIICQK